MAKQYIGGKQIVAKATARCGSDTILIFVLALGGGLRAVAFSDVPGLRVYRNAMRSVERDSLTIWIYNPHVSLGGKWFCSQVLDTISFREGDRLVIDWALGLG